MRCIRRVYAAEINAGGAQVCGADYCTVYGILCTCPCISVIKRGCYDYALRMNKRSGCEERRGGWRDPQGPLRRRPDQAHLQSAYQI